MTVSHAGIPRLQELSYLDVTARAVQRGSTFEDVRQSLVRHMEALRRGSLASGNIATFRMTEEDPGRYVRNASDALKELMRLGLVCRAAVPSTASAARSYQKTTFTLTEAGETWVGQLQSDPKGAADLLFTKLWAAHPQFAGYLRIVQEGLVVPLAQWGEIPTPRTREHFVDFLVARTAQAVSVGATHWTATADEVRTAITEYTGAIADSAKSRQKPDPFRRNQDFVSTCEQAMVKLAFQKSGLTLDYISQEILRRWTKDLGLANFSYHVPGPNALRYWPTASLEEDGGTVQVERRGGDELRDQVIQLLAEAYERARGEDPEQFMWVPIYRVRAAVCWRLRIADALFDRALVEFLMGERGSDVAFAINLDQAQYGSVPPTELPLRVPHSGGVRVYYSMSLIPGRGYSARERHQTSLR